MPNPPVACVIGDADQIVAQGYTEEPAQYHTEAGALSFHTFIVRINLTGLALTSLSNLN
ncbi:Pyrimidine deaminase domain of riboflavin biosynthesis protein RibD [Nostoc flagelliforme CCNUN1]|uniref:Pyrimidine deaminase domain of riboflavin biosynthesis protein RibD n=1 Tax=Nostoc flagelliforme CCNUN1 TaxID=2038116 RepID=A0A2K8SQZ8_9NOSO|nr:hypothetical protein [Nostoc flagelliforme]AUB37889.1 Pyrimidine deaminase domain of riboflavin biosynthesis protein RibD [Nostoc flagelliforme CCNUN1]